MTNKYFEELYLTLVNGNIDIYKQRLRRMRKKTLIKFIQWANANDISPEGLRLNYLLSDY